MRMRPWLFAVLLAWAVIPAIANSGAIILQSTTSTRNSGLYEHLLPIFSGETGIEVHVVAVGTGQALKNARNCDGDVVLVHAREAEEAFIAAGYGVERFDLMYNDFVIVGPPSDPAGIAGMDDASAALARIAASRSALASRGDDSGTHKKELSLWQAANTDPGTGSGEWYLETGSGMGATLNVAVAKGAYTLTDRASWITFGNKLDFEVLVEGDGALFNQYGVMRVNPERCPESNAIAGGRFVDWLLSPTGQQAIAAYRLDGEALFTPNAR